MHRASSGLAVVAAAAIAFSLPATAKNYVGGGVPEAKSTVGTLPPSFGRPGGPGFDGCTSRGDRHIRRDRGFADCGSGVAGWYGGEWAEYNNRSWESDSYNDWWHDRPDRAFPRWMSRNQDCARQWYAGNVLSC